LRERFPGELPGEPPTEDVGAEEAGKDGVALEETTGEAFEYEVAEEAEERIGVEELEVVELVVGVKVEGVVDVVEDAEAGKEEAIVVEEVCLESADVEVEAVEGVLPVSACSNRTITTETLSWE